MTISHKEFKDQLSYARSFSNRMNYPPSNERRVIVSRGRPWPKRLPDGQYVYVVLPNTGEVRFSETPRPESKIHHPALCNGGDVIGAGLFMLHKTIVAELSNESGHYAPDSDSMYYVKLAFVFWGIPLSNQLNIDTRWEAFS